MANAEGLDPKPRDPRPFKLALGQVRVVVLVERHDDPHVVVQVVLVFAWWKRRRVGIGREIQGRRRE